MSFVNSIDVPVAASTPVTGGVFLECSRMTPSCALKKLGCLRDNRRQARISFIVIAAVNSSIGSTATHRGRKNMLGRAGWATTDDTGFAHMASLSKPQSSKAIYASVYDE